jgi:hypothetical protein
LNSETDSGGRVGRKVSEIIVARRCRNVGVAPALVSVGVVGIMVILRLNAIDVFGRDRFGVGIQVVVGRVIVVEQS